MAFSKQLLISYVEGLQLVPFDKDVSTSATNAHHQDKASVVGSLAVGFHRGLDPKLKADIENSMLFAMLAASAKYDQTEQAKDWYTFYKGVLENLGWTISKFDWASVEVSGKGSVDKLVLKIGESYFSPAEFKLLNRIVEALPNAANGDAQKILDKYSIGSKMANFQVAIGGASGGDAILDLAGYMYAIQGKTDHVLFAKYSGEFKLEYISQRMTLNDRVYSQVRQAVIDKLGDAVRLIVDIKLFSSVYSAM